MKLARDVAASRGDLFQFQTQTQLFAVRGGLPSGALAEKEKAEADRAALHTGFSAKTVDHRAPRLVRSLGYRSRISSQGRPLMGSIVRTRRPRVIRVSVRGNTVRAIDKPAKPTKAFRKCGFGAAGRVVASDTRVRCATCACNVRACVREQVSCCTCIQGVWAQ